MDDYKGFTQRTISHYQENSESFWQGTKNHDVDQNYAALQARLPGIQGVNILDFGCGPGRDLKYFSDCGYTVTGLDGCANFCSMARAYSGCEVLEQNFCKLELPSEMFHGIFANASLFHIPKNEFIDVLKILNLSLLDDGLLFCSNPRGTGDGFDGSRYGNYMEYEEYKACLRLAGFEVIDHYYRPAGRPREEQHWLAIIARKV
jgi:SAM-dependent methyltransferase